MKSDFRACDVCGQTGMNPQYYDGHMKRCHKPCDKCRSRPMTVEVMVVNAVSELWVCPAIGLCAECFSSLNLPNTTSNKETP